MACMGLTCLPKPKSPDQRPHAMPTSFRQIIDKAVKDKRFLVVPGAHDALSARLIQRIGVEASFVGGFPPVGARYGVPDVGLKGFGEISAAVRDIMGACDLPVFVDGADGYGDVKNVVHTVQTYERMGVSAILIEDQQWPKRCGHMVGKKVVPIELAEAKIKAAASERIDPETWILGRTDEIEDQQWPKRCGHMVGKKVVPIELAEAKIKAAASERIDPETWILGRTDARAVYDLDEA